MSEDFQSIGAWFSDLFEAVWANWEKWESLDWQQYFGSGLFFFTALITLLVIWRVSSKEVTLKNGQVLREWIAPSQWFGRWQQLRLEGYAKAPSWSIRLLQALHIAHNWLGAAMVCLLLLFFLILTFILDTVQGRVLSAFASALSVWLIRYLVKK